MLFDLLIWGNRVSLSEVCFKNINLIALKKGKLEVVRLVEMQDNKYVDFISCSENKDYDIDITDVA